MTQTGACMVNSLSVVADKYGTGDTFAVTHLTSNTATTVSLLATSIYNPGASIATMFDFPAMESMLPNEILRFTYTNTATIALNVYLIVEYVGILRTV